MSDRLTDTIEDKHNKKLTVSQPAVSQHPNQRKRHFSAPDALLPPMKPKANTKPHPALQILLQCPVRSLVICSLMKNKSRALNYPLLRLTPVFCDYKKSTWLPLSFPQSRLTQQGQM
ncbi:hypothetical protein SeMB42_g06330 [Synchytrium endobioticum]|uniref:Uncharacterized protein n=1 Tax=Synchytrium endobioticum TaxID=286115 RepID=A0A507CLQ4_9FUNG|nr:hypothetical protein SeMB42_g06330 [Synchytrium endobioticum]TPX43893.1 hypothetical protein SeLEV6574_g04809 [Synchytrium endobioticum]